MIGTDEILIRKIEPSDNPVLASIIRQSLSDFNAAKPGTVYFDPTTDHLSDVFTAKGSCYFVAEVNGVIAGGAGIYPTDALPPFTCELVKLYLKSDARGKGVGRMLMDKCTAAAKDMGYKHIYLETMPELKIAVPMYEKAGYKKLTAPLGNSGHTGCNIWMMKSI